MVTSLFTDRRTVLVRVASYRRAAIAAAAFSKCGFSSRKGSSGRSRDKKKSNEVGELHFVFEDNKDISRLAFGG